MKECDLIHHVYWKMRLKFERKLEELNLNFLHVQTLFILRNGPVEQSELTLKLGVVKGTTSKILQHLEARGLIRRERVKKRYLVHMTEEGKAVLQEIRKVGQELDSLMFEGFTPQERETLRELLWKMLRNMGWEEE
ncbi:MarR family winged helix-turn-helix transcriptional regulator [Palaeococcus ferrophilus]|uniref:MarR family winged helix-turn-helix transcriptional regulator n=1 Tax=Palaeococcus ferrophilus TaxID=83868 RepID=UPI000696E07F|nr:MarR family transcriptional regulator [Palaeococcus ferrophilus]